MRRRSILSSAVGLLGAGVAGCLGQSDSDADRAPPTETTAELSTDQPTNQSTTDQRTQYAATVAPKIERLQPAAVSQWYPDSIGVIGDGQQYLFYRVDVTDGSPPVRSAFRFRFDGDTYAPGVGDDDPLSRVGEPDDRYTAERGSGWLVFELPESGDAGDAAFVLGTDEWAIPESLRERLAEPAPVLSLDWAVTEEQPPGESTLGFAVTNDGDRDTWFVGALNAVEMYAAIGPVKAFRRRVPAGETVSWELTHDNGVDPGDSSVGDGQPDGSYRLFWNGGKREREIRVVAQDDGG